MELERGWLRCGRCGGLVRSHGYGEGGCEGGAGGYHPGLTEEREYKMVAGDAPGSMQAGWRLCRNCSCLFYQPGGGVCPNGGPHAVEGGPDLPGVVPVPYAMPFGAYPDAQTGWRWCRNCQILFDTNHGSVPCFWGTGDHDGSASADYVVVEVAMGLESWAQCSTCKSLVEATTSGGCLDGAAHVAGAGVRVAYGGGREKAQEGWRRCSRCRCLVRGVTSPGVCRVLVDGGSTQPHEFKDSRRYHVTQDAEEIDEIAGWRHCSKCEVMTFTTFGDQPCPAGDSHDVSQSPAYSVLADEVDGRTRGWRSCSKCRSMVFAPLSDGLCRDGTLHDTSQSRAYQLGDPGFVVGLDQSWHWCGRCQGLVHSDGPCFGGVCFDGAPHDYTDSPNHGLPRDFLPEEGVDTFETGWRMCAVCRQLVLTDAGTPVGLCANGATHDVAASTDFQVYYQPPPPPPVPDQDPTLPALTITETADVVTVAGSRFTASVTVEVSVDLPGSLVSVKSVTGADGSFSVQLSPVEPAPEGGVLVRAEDDELTTAQGRLTSFVPLPPPA